MTVVALSADHAEEARAMAEDHDVAFQVVYGLDPVEDAERIGAYHDEEKGIIQPAGFVLKGDEVRMAVYANGPIGRLWADETLKQIDQLRQEKRGV